MSGSDVHDMSYYKKCMVGGILSCGITHALVCPLDIVKCRMQVSTRNEFFMFNAVFFLNRLCQVSTRVSVMVSKLSTLQRELKDSPL